MNAKQRMDALVGKVEDTSTRLLRRAHELGSDSNPWEQRELLAAAREYADAIRSLHRGIRSAK